MHRGGVGATADGGGEAAEEEETAHGRWRRGAWGLGFWFWREGVGWGGELEETGLLVVGSVRSRSSEVGCTARDGLTCRII